MLAASIIVFREVIEAGLIVGIVLAATRGVRSRTVYVLGGIAAGVIGASLLAAFAGTLSNALEGVGQGGLQRLHPWPSRWSCSAGTMSGWLSMAENLRRSSRPSGQAVVAGSKTLTALAIVVAIAVLREGAEVVLFLYGVVHVRTEKVAWGLFTGGVLGLAAGASMSALDLCGAREDTASLSSQLTSHVDRVPRCRHGIPMRRLPSNAPISLTLWSTTLWDTFLAPCRRRSLAGRVLHTLIGYDDRPSIMQAVDLHCDARDDPLGHARVCASKTESEAKSGGCLRADEAKGCGLRGRQSGVEPTNSPA